jgi:hypothetical protein
VAIPALTVVDFMEDTTNPAAGFTASVDVDPRNRNVNVGVFTSPVYRHNRRLITADPAENLFSLQIVELVNPQAYCPACTYSSLYIVLNFLAHTVAVYRGGNQLSCPKNVETVSWGRYRVQSSTLLNFHRAMA